MAQLERVNLLERVVAMLDFFSQTSTMIGMAVVLVALIGLLIYMRTRPND